MASKKILRQVYLDKRLTITQGEYQKRNQLLIKNVREHLDLRKVRMIHTYLSIAKQKEVDTFELIEELKKSNEHVKVAVSKSIPPRQLEHYLLTDETHIEINSWGIPEPNTGTRIDIKNIDLVFVPLIAFDKKGHRIGYGGGYYDKFLAQLGPGTLKVGLSLSPALDYIEYTEEFDIPLDSCITPFEFFKFTLR